MTFRGSENRRRDIVYHRSVLRQGGYCLDGRPHFWLARFQVEGEGRTRRGDEDKDEPYSKDDMGRMLKRETKMDKSAEEDEVPA